MIINEDKKIVLLQNPKTGGRFKASNLSNGFERYEISEYYCDGEKKSPIFPFHITYNELKEFLGDDWEKYSIYTVIRNPYNRFVSAVNFKFRSIFKEKGKPTIDHALDVIEKNKEVLKLKKDTIWFTPQSRWLGNGVKILKYESLEDWDFICDLIGICKGNIHIRAEYGITDEQKKRIKQLYKEDKLIFEMYE